MAFHETDQYIPGDVGGACFFCGSSRRGEERIFRTDRDIDYEGNVAICETCAGELAAQIDWISPSQARALKAKNVDLAKTVKEATAALNAARDTVEALRAYDEAGLSA